MTGIDTGPRMLSTVARALERGFEGWITVDFLPRRPVAVVEGRIVALRRSCRLEPARLVNRSRRLGQNRPVRDQGRTSTST